MHRHPLEWDAIHFSKRALSKARLLPSLMALEIILSIVNEHFNDVDEKDRVCENLEQIWSLPVRWPTPLLGSAHFKDSQLFCRFVLYGTEYV